MPSILAVAVPQVFASYRDLRKETKLAEAASRKERTQVALVQMQQAHQEKEILRHERLVIEHQTKKEEHDEKLSKLQLKELDLVQASDQRIETQIAAELAAEEYYSKKAIGFSAETAVA